MKSVATALLLAAMISCRQDASKGVLSESLSNESLLAAKTSRISAKPSHGEIVKRVLRNLDTIEFHRKIIIDMATSEQPGRQENTNSANEEIERLNLVIEKNKKDIALLNDVLKDYEETEILLNDTIMLLTERLAETEAALEMMKHFYANTEEQYREVESELYAMSIVNFAQYKKIERITDSISRVYYIAQSEDYLLGHEIIKKENGVFSFIKPKELNPNAANFEFTKTDRRRVFTIPLGKGKARLVTNHPDGSYQISVDETKINRLVILNPAEFWKVSRYLVVVIR